MTNQHRRHRSIRELLGWPKSLFRFFSDIFHKEIFGQPNIKMIKENAGWKIKKKKEEEEEEEGIF